jgi:hypothetical protein
VNALRRRQQFLSWIALVAVLALALLPTVSHALAFVQGERAPWAEVCSAQRSTRVAAGPEGGAPLAGHAAIEHCVWCGLSGTDLVPPPEAACTMRADGSAELPVSVSATEVATCRVWAPALPRAPPARA